MEGEGVEGANRRNLSMILKSCGASWQLPRLGLPGISIAEFSSETPRRCELPSWKRVAD